MPPATGFNGQGEPVGAIGYPSYELYFDKLSLAGWTFYADIVDTNLSVSLTSLHVWQPHSSINAGQWITYPDVDIGQWTTYTHAIMHRPTYERQGANGYMVGVKILFTELY